MTPRPLSPAEKWRRLRRKLNTMIDEHVALAGKATTEKVRIYHDAFACGLATAELTMSRLSRTRTRRQG